MYSQNIAIHELNKLTIKELEELRSVLYARICRAKENFEQYSAEEYGEYLSHVVQEIVNKGTEKLKVIPKEPEVVPTECFCGKPIKVKALRMCSTHSQQYYRKFGKIQKAERAPLSLRDYLI